MTTTTRARAWALSRRDGLTLGFTDHDRPLGFESIVFKPDGGMTALAIMQGAGLAVDNSEAQGVLSDDAITDADLDAGRWDNAEVRMWDVDWSAPADRRLVFRGTLGEVTRSGLSFRAELRGLGEALNRPLGRVYHPRCAAILGDAQCKANLSAPGYATESAIGAVEDGRLFRFVGLPGFDARWFERGTLVVLDGAAAGLSGAIKRDMAGPGGREIELWTALTAGVAGGDRVRLIAGCDKTPATCRLKFANYLNFRGFPHLPSEDWLIAPQAVGNRVTGG